jgi:hypothetical protein
MHAELEPLTALVRVFEPGCGYGRPYSYVATIRWLNPETAEVMGVLHAPTPGQWRAIRKALKQVGVRRAIIQRIKDDHKQQHVVE